MSDVDEIRSILGFEPYRGEPIDWDAAGLELGATVPGDFRELIDAAGSGKIGNDTLLLRPFAPDRRFDQIARNQRRLRELETIWENEAEYVPDELTKPTVFNEPGVRPVLWATSGLGFNLFWIARDDTPPSSWRIAVEPARGGMWQFHDGTATNFLLRLLRGEEPSRFLYYLEDADQHFFASRE
jgi:hypothetical protein